ncbi:hypothetical protein M0812_02423 [Anaeramoeba flamelloides]|uniref:Calponin-homology (CH) domain-containing protein n=1 Tax=Anaeramoeba flamelloides TaxID=1746091 RepID=A0AAV7YQ25_9EUKA|nr:hypothetical protein M0812_02423 [Anaeramoeba flamelloides]
MEIETLESELLEWTQSYLPQIKSILEFNNYETLATLLRKIEPNFPLQLNKKNPRLEDKLLCFESLTLALLTFLKKRIEQPLPIVQYCLIVISQNKKEILSLLSLCVLLSVLCEQKATNIQNITSLSINVQTSLMKVIQLLLSPPKSENILSISAQTKKTEQPLNKANFFDSLELKSNPKTTEIITNKTQNDQKKNTQIQKIKNRSKNTNKKEKEKEKENENKNKNKNKNREYYEQETRNLLDKLHGEIGNNKKLEILLIKIEKENHILNKKVRQQEAIIKQTQKDYEIMEEKYYQLKQTKSRDHLSYELKIGEIKSDSIEEKELLQKQVNKLTKSNQVLKKKFDQLIEKKYGSGDEQRRRNEKMVELENQLTKHKTQKIELSLEIEYLNQKNQRLIEKQSQFRNQLKQTEATEIEVSRLSLLNKTQSITIERLKKQNNELNSEIDRFQKKIDNLEIDSSLILKQATNYYHRNNFNLSSHDNFNESGNTGKKYPFEHQNEEISLFKRKNSLSLKDELNSEKTNKIIQQKNIKTKMWKNRAIKAEEELKHLKANYETIFINKVITNLAIENWKLKWTNRRIEIKEKQKQKQNVKNLTWMSSLRSQISTKFI